MHQRRHQPGYQGQHGDIFQQRPPAEQRHVDQGERRDDAGQIGEEIADDRLARHRHGRRQAIGTAADWLDEGCHPQCQKQAGNADRHKCRLPADQAQRTAAGIGCVPTLHHHRADQQRNAAAEIQAGGINGDGGGATGLGEPIGNHRIGRRTSGRLANANADAGKRKLAETAGEARHRRHPRPEGKAQRQQPCAHPVIRQPANRHPEQRVEHRKGRAVEESQLGIGEIEVALDVFSQDRQDLPIDEVHHIHQHE